MKYKTKIGNAVKEVRRWQDNNTGTTNVKWTKEQSRAVLNELCPLCEFDGLCEISTVTYGKLYKLCKVKSWDLQNTWIMITEDRTSIEIGKKYGMLTVKNYRHYIGKKFRDSHLWWICQCDCGNYVTQRGYNLINGHTKSCGCIHGNRYSRMNLKSIVQNVDKKNRKYRKGSSTNPDGTRHIEHTDYSSPVGCRSEHMVIHKDKNNQDNIIKFYASDKCSGCRKEVKFNQHRERQCDNCGLINGVTLVGS